MAYKDFDKIVSNTTIPDDYDIGSDVMCAIYARVKQADVFEAIYDVFKYGFALGASYQKNKRK